MDLEEFNTLYQGILKMEKGDMTHYFNKLPVGVRKGFLKELSKKSQDEYLDFLDDIRDIAIQEFWTNERELLKQGECTRNWLPEQIEDIYNISIETGESRTCGGMASELDKDGSNPTKKHDNKKIKHAYIVHQMLSVDTYPEYAGIYKNLQAVSEYSGEHLRAHKGNYMNSTNWYYDCESGNYHTFG